MLFSYLKRHYKIILLLVIFSLIFAGVFSLYDLPVESVLYSVILCLVIGLALFAIGYFRFLRRHRTLTELQKNVTISLDGLPSPGGAIERDYQELLNILRAFASGVQASAETERREAEDYYTMWVHQIKTPISAMHLLLQSEKAENSTAMEAELFQIERYVEMALSYFRLDSQSSDYVLREYELDGILRQSIRKYAKLFIIKKLPLNFSDTQLKVMTDEKWLSFVIEQVVSNALKYTSHGSISIYAEGTTLVVADTGIGIRPDDLPRVFEKGFTGYNGRENKKSTGIGLYLCRRVCDNLGHRISIVSAPGEGTQVRISLAQAARVIE